MVGRGCVLALAALATASAAIQDLHSFPKYDLRISPEKVLNETASKLLADRADGLDSTGAAVHLMRTPAGQAFLCTVPKAQLPPPSSRADAEPRLEHEALRQQVDQGLALLDSMRGGCLFVRQGWFTYSFCYGGMIRQFHERDVRLPGVSGIQEDPNSESYVLGQFPAEPLPVPKYGSGTQATANRKASASIGGEPAGMGGRYLVQQWKSGTVCDKTGLPRETQVQFHCSTQSTDRIALIRETAICTYVFIIHTSRLCGEPLFNEGQNKTEGPVSSIECRPVVKKMRESKEIPFGASPFKIVPEHHAPAAEDPFRAPQVEEQAPPLFEQGKEQPPTSTPEPLEPEPVVEPEQPPPKEERQEEVEHYSDAEEHYYGDTSPNPAEEAYLDTEDMLEVLSFVFDADTGELLAEDSIAHITLQEAEDLAGIEEGERHAAGEQPTEERLESLAQLMRQSIEDALRGDGSQDPSSTTQKGEGAADDGHYADELQAENIEKIVNNLLDRRAGRTRSSRRQLLKEPLQRLQATSPKHQELLRNLIKEWEEPDDGEDEGPGRNPTPAVEAAQPVADVATPPARSHEEL